MPDKSQRKGSATLLTHYNPPQTTPNHKFPPLSQFLAAPLLRNTPNFLDIMTDLSEVVAFYTICDSKDADNPENIFNKSQKNSRFYS